MEAKNFNCPTDMLANIMQQFNAFSLENQQDGASSLSTSPPKSPAGGVSEFQLDLALNNKASSLTNAAVDS